MTKQTQNPYRYPAASPEANVELTKTGRRWLRYTVSFPSAHPTRYLENNTVRGEYLRPRTAGELPLAILIHGLGDRSLIPARLLARYLVGRGIACFVLYLVLHSSRKPPRRAAPLTTDDWFENYRISVIDVRQVIDWAQTRDELSKERIGVVGISFGGFISAIAMGVDERLKAGAMVASAGNLEKIAFMSKTLPKKWGFRYTKAKFDARQRRYARYLKEAASKGVENTEPPERDYLIDAMTFAHRLRDRPLLMINARWDEVIPKQAVLDFWEESGRPAIFWLPGGHATIWLGFPLIGRKIHRFLGAAFQA